MNFINLGHSAEVNAIKYTMAKSMGVLLLFTFISFVIYIFKKTNKQQPVKTSPNV